MSTYTSKADDFKPAASVRGRRCHLEHEYGLAWAGTSPAILERYPDAMHFGLLGEARVLIEGRVYQPVADGERGLIIAVRGNPDGDPETDNSLALVTGGPLLDLVAVPFGRPNAWALRVGSVTFLGACEPQFVSPPPVPIWRTPINWLRGGAEGICLLTDDPREQQHILLHFRELAAENLQHGEELERIVSRPWLVPRVVVPRQSRVA